ncbi:hypothetical protein IB238_07615 [Rhizobium sp. ARZ01]|uniref:hypothetical protein n=1 Tax=Rhizobium sp. ARZ01 TaxID=2769313 RepID=UPI00177D6C42|nr:hypothetical protein [Rhizobium sp. ARZ01]MBD9372485.1 hypothetical protein [Rhizobium sp. ARZ01]
MTLGKGRVSLVVSLALVLASCQSEDKPPQPRFVSDYRGYPESGPTQRAEKRYFIEFRSRYALSYGHTYVIFGRTDKSGRMINPEVAGLAPASTDAAPYVLGHFVPVPAETGASDGDLEEEYRSASWRVMLTEAEYQKTVAFIRQLKAKSKYWQATVNNCNAWTGEIAKSMGYKTPPIWLRPQQFITQLREMNGG